MCSIAESNIKPLLCVILFKKLLKKRACRKYVVCGKKKSIYAERFNIVMVQPRI